MKKIITFILLVGLGGMAIASSGKLMAEGLKKQKGNGITFFNGTWEEALKKADKENKYIFLDAYAEWCGPCKLMAKKTFTDKKVGAFFNNNFINIKMDMELHEEGPRLSRKFELTAYPSLYFIDKNEEVIYMSIGYLVPDELIIVGKEALKQ